MPHGASAVQLGQLLHVKYIRYQPHTFVLCNLHIPGDRNAGTFLAPVLQRIEAKICQGRGFGIVQLDPALQPASG